MRRTTALSSNRESMRHLLRLSTRADQRSVGNALSVLNLSERVGYGMFLNIHYSALSSLATWWAESDHPEFQALLNCTISDLQGLGYRIGASDSVIADTACDPRRQWGIAYVIRRSRLGADIVRRLVPAAHPTRYLDHELQCTWRDFLRQLDARTEAMSAGDREEIVTGARFALRAFADAAGMARS